MGNNSVIIMFIFRYQTIYVINIISIRAVALEIRPYFMCGK